MATGPKLHQVANSHDEKELPTCSSLFTKLILCKQLLKYLSKGKHSLK